MKKALVLTVAIVLILTGSFLILRQQTLAARPLEIEKVLPSQAVLYLRVANIKKNIDGFIATQFWQKLKQIHFKQVLREMNVSEIYINQYASAKNQFQKLTEDPWSQNLFSKEIAVAFYPAQEPNVQITSEEVAKNVIFVLRLTAQAEFAEFISRVSQNFGKHVSFEKREYNGHTITLVKPDKGNNNIYYFKIKDLLVISLREDFLHNSINAIKKQKQSLKDEEGYKLTKEKLLKDADVVFYYNYKMFLSTIKDQVVKQLGEKGDKQKLEETFKQFSGFNTMGYAFVPGELLKQNFVMLYEKDKLDPFVQKFYSCPADENKSLNIVPHNVIAYSWNNCFPFEEYWQYLKSEFAKESADAKAKTALDTFLVNFEKNLNVSLENDILPALGDEYGGYFYGMDLSGMFPVPQFSFFVRIADLAKAEKVMSALANQPLILLQNENYKGTNVRFITLPLGGNIKPGYCFLGDYLLFATSRDLLFESIRVFNKESQSLVDAPAFKEINEGLTDKNNGVFYFKIDELASKLRGVVQWGQQWLSLRVAQEKAFREGQKKRLEFLEQEITKEQSDLESFKGELKILVESQTAETIDSVKVDALKKQINASESSLVAAEAKQTELQSFLQTPDTSQAESAKIETLITKIVYPLLDALQNVHAIGTRTIIKDNAIESYSFTTVD